ncbi:MAG: ATP synthase F1 subunit epsilon [Nitrospiria bacterium]
MKTFHIKIITPEQVVFDDVVTSVVVPGGSGSFGVLANHAPLISTLTPGRLTLSIPNGKKETFQIGPGFIDILDNEVSLLSESVTPEVSKATA